MARKSCLFQAVQGVVALGAAGVATYVCFVRPWHMRWGATDDEVARALPGDDLLPSPRVKVTHAVTIQAPVDKVWPWVAQIGQGRGGFYSYEFIENAMGADIHNADRILPEFQNPRVGDRLPLAQGGFGVPIVVVEPNRALVVHGDTRQEGDDVQWLKPGDYMAVTWGWHLYWVDERATRLVERFSADYNPTFVNQVYFRAFMEPGAFVMQRKMLLGIKERAERNA